MNIKETIKMLCSLITEVGAHLKHVYAHDCICGDNPIGTRVDMPVLEFIKSAIHEKMQREPQYQELVLVRGIPGSGKSTYARRMFPFHSNFEADMWFEKTNTAFEPKHLRTAHEWCQENTRKAILNKENVVVSNTFTMPWEMEYYEDLANELGVILKVYRMDNDYGSIHNVPAITMRNMKEKINANPVSGEIIIKGDTK